MTIESLPQRGHNHFNLLRMAAASAVLVYHAFRLSWGDAGHALVSTGIKIDLASAALTTFFAISGFFVFLSFERHRSKREFIAARVARILPGLLVCALLTAFLVGPLFTQLSPSAYFSEASVWLYPLQVVSLAKMMGATLPAMFAANPYPFAVNESLWTIYFEVACYAGLLISGLVGLLGRHRFHWLLAAYAPAYFIARYGPWPELVYFAVFSLAFVIGMTIFRYRDRGILKGWVAALLLAASLAAAACGFPVEELWTLSIAYGALWLGFAGWRWPLAYNRIGDFSYGTYLYGFIVQQITAALLPGIAPLGMIALTLPAAVLCGAASWHLVERPGLRLARLGGRTEPAGAAFAS
jgi:peptidoglycan/LPS O-acetylase OafA/YrhL